ncbi:hypothetical protein GCM10009677_61350 [Sphaerisporangium rubeum]
MLVLKLAAEFQGFARDLHDEAVDYFAVHVANGKAAVETILRERMTSERNLDKKNAQADSLLNDFGRLGLTLWSALERADRQAQSWRTELTKFNQMRNALAHDDQARVHLLRQQGYRLDHSTVQTWERTLDSLAQTMDDVVGDYLSALLGVGRPW